MKCQENYIFGFHAKLDLIRTTFHTLVKYKIITFNSYNYIFVSLSPKYIRYVFLKITFPVRRI